MDEELTGKQTNFSHVKQNPRDDFTGPGTSHQEELCYYSLIYPLISCGKCSIKAEPFPISLLQRKFVRMVTGAEVLIHPFLFGTAVIERAEYWWLLISFPLVSVWPHPQVGRCWSSLSFVVCGQCSIKLRGSSRSELAFMLHFASRFLRFFSKDLKQLLQEFSVMEMRPDNSTCRSMLLRRYLSPLWRFYSYSFLIGDFSRFFILFILLVNMWQAPTAASFCCQVDAFYQPSRVAPSPLSICACFFLHFWIFFPPLLIYIYSPAVTEHAHSSGLHLVECTWWI